MTSPKPAASKRSRSPPSPNSILDRPALIRALDDRGISLKKQQIDGFYQALHRQHYPDLDKFVENYHRNEAREEQTDFRPLVNDISRKKNRNPTQLNRHLLEFLKDPDNGFVTITTKIDLALLSKDGTTTKLAVRLHDGHVVESVLMRYVNKSGCRASLCVSSQVGCAMGCTFCATATMGIKGNLTSYEILEQIIHANRILAEEAVEQGVLKNNDTQQKNDAKLKKLALVRNVVFMGMGEPLNNYDNVVEACRSLIDHKRWHLAQGKVTVSTVGVTPRIRDLTRDLPQVNLALSLHAPTQSMRTEIVPAAKAYKIEGLIEALDNHMMAFLKRPTNDGSVEFTAEQRIKESTKKRAMIEYVMLEGPTSTFESAHQLGKLCENRHLLVNLIPYNQTDVKDKLKCPSDEHMSKFQDILASYKVVCTIRRTMGADIGSACGQLVVQKKQQDQEAKLKQIDIEDAAGTTRNSVGTKVSAAKRSAPVNSLKQAEEDVDRIIKPLAIVTGIAATCFVMTTILFLDQRKRR